MHACGHDGHSSILLAYAKALVEHKDIFETVQKRKDIPKSEYISLDEMAKKFDIDTSSL
jgi:hypothetical protein